MYMDDLDRKKIKIDLRYAFDLYVSAIETTDDEVILREILMAIGTLQAKTRHAQQNLFNLRKEIREVAT